MLMNKQPELASNSDRRFTLLFLVASSALFLIVLAFTIYFFFFRQEGPPGGSGASTSTTGTFKYFSKLTGLPVKEENEITPRIAAIMVDNNPDGYPIIGLNDASVVYEAPVEGGISRFLAIYPEKSLVEKVGPVRSARPYYLDWSAEYGDSLYMHCGGSAEGLNEIDERDIFDANEFTKTPYFWRDKSRFAPYNLFTSSERWQRYYADYGGSRTVKDWDGWVFGELNSTTTETAREFSVEYLNRFVVGWRYNTSTQNYARLLNGEEFLDDKSNQIFADNVIVQFSSISVIDEVGRRKIITTGEGDARILRNGYLVRGTWKKEKSDSRTRFYDRDNQEIILTPGRTWVMVVSKNATLTVVN